MAIHPRADTASHSWREELSERIEQFRKRRARFQPETDSAGNLELEFAEPGRAEASHDVTLEAPEEDHSPHFDSELGESAAAPEKETSPPGTSSPREYREMMHLDTAPVEADNGILLGGPVKTGPAVEADDEISLGGPVETSPAVEADDEISLGEPVETSPLVEPDEEMSLGEPAETDSPVEIMVGSSGDTAPETETATEPEGIMLAPLGRRTLAGLVDALVLILGAAVFGAIFWRFCGTLSLIPLSFAVIGFRGSHRYCFRYARTALDGMRGP
jgi:hypothetical protein